MKARRPLAFARIRWRSAMLGQRVQQFRLMAICQRLAFPGLPLLQVVTLASLGGCHSRIVDVQPLLRHPLATVTLDLLCGLAAVSLTEGALLVDVLGAQFGDRIARLLPACSISAGYGRRRVVHTVA